VRDEGEEVAVGALTRHHDVANDPTMQEHCGLLAAVAAEVGDPQVRHRGTIGDARVALTNMGETPVRATAVEDALRGASSDAIATAAEAAAEGTSPPSDAEASAEFRQHLARVLTRRTVEAALGS
jgi:CO/xanthine dehydrogenase FAD-binding subunit